MSRALYPTSSIPLCVAAILFASLYHSAHAQDSAADPYETDAAAFIAEVDQTYPFFDLKRIRETWTAAKQELTEQAAKCSSDTEFLGLVQNAIAALHDSHVYLGDTKATLPPRPKKYYPGLSFMPATQNRVVIMWAGKPYADKLEPGAIVTQIDGKNAREFLYEHAWKVWDEGYYPSLQRARLFAQRIPLKGNKGDRHTLSYISDGEEKTLELTCDTEARSWPHTYNLPPNLTRVGRSFHYAKLDWNIGYMYLRRVDESILTGMRQALDQFDDVAGWIVDLRGNAGGGYGRDLLEQIQAIPSPVAVLIDAGCASAGETLARDFVNLKQARLFGSRTAGSSSAKRTWAFPSGIATLRLPTRSRFGINREPIEFNGIHPHVEVEATPQEVALGLNSTLLRAAEYLRTQRTE